MMRSDLSRTLRIALAIIFASAFLPAGVMPQARAVDWWDQGYDYGTFANTELLPTPLPGSDQSWDVSDDGQIFVSVRTGAEGTGLYYLDRSMISYDWMPLKDSNGRLIQLDLTDELCISGSGWIIYIATK